MGKNETLLRNLYMVVFVLFSTIVSAQSRYTVYRSTGDVQVKKFRMEEWSDLKKNDNIILVDILRIPEDGFVSVLDNKSRSLYKFEGKCEASLKLMIDEAVKKSDDITSKLNKELLSSAVESTMSTSSHTRVAASFRGQGIASYLDSLCLYILNKSKNALYSKSASCWYFDNHESSDSLSFKLIKTSELESYFTFSNRSSHDVYVNIIYVDDNHTARLCYEFDYLSGYPFIFVPAGNDVSLPQYKFIFPDVEGCCYMLSTDEVYDSHALQLMLSKQRL